LAVPIEINLEDFSDEVALFIQKTDSLLATGVGNHLYIGPTRHCGDINQMENLFKFSGIRQEFTENIGGAFKEFGLNL